MRHLIVIGTLLTLFPRPLEQWHPKRLSGNVIYLEYLAGHDDVAKNSRVVVCRNTMYSTAFLLTNPRHLLCRFRVPCIGVIKESNTVVAVNRINQDVRLPILICKVTRLGEYHRIPRLPVSTWLRRHDECLGCIVCGSHPELHLLETLQLAFGVLGDEVSSKYIIDKLAQPVGIRQVRSYGVAAVTVVAPFLNRTSTSGRGAHSAFEIGHTVIGNLRNKQTFAENALFHFKDAILVDAPSGNAGEELAELDPISEGYGEGSAVSSVFVKEHILHSINRTSFVRITSFYLLAIYQQITFNI